MSMDRSLRVRKAMVRNRSVLTRAERIQRLLSMDRWKEGDSPLRPSEGLRAQNYRVKKRRSKKKAEAGPRQLPRRRESRKPGKAVRYGCRFEGFRLKRSPVT